MCNGNIGFQVLYIFYRTGIIVAWFKVGVVRGTIMIFNILPANIIGTKPVYLGCINSVVGSKRFWVMAVPGIFVVFNQLADSPVFFGGINLLCFYT